MSVHPTAEAWDPGAPGPDPSLVTFYILCAVAALFCAMALGLGPLVFALAGLLAAVVGFRARRPRWWGLPLAAAGVGEALGALAGWRTRTVVVVAVVLFVILTVVRMAGHRSAPDRNGRQLGVRR